MSQETGPTDDSPDGGAAESKQSSRLLSLDALRGFDMFWITGVDWVILKTQEAWPTRAFGVVAGQFKHKEWAGFGFYDLIFPLFIYLVGITTVFSLDKLIAQGDRLGAYKRIGRRFVLLYFVALLYNDSFWGEHVRFIGVLQRIAWCYLFASLLYCNLRWRGLLAVFAAILIGYWALLTFVPPPGASAPTFEIHKTWPNWVDKHYLPDGDMEPRGWRNEGILSTVPAIATCLLGVFTGIFLKDRRWSDMQRVGVLAAAGVILLVAGYTWGLQFPVIKRIWTSTYVLVAGGYSALLLSLFMYIVDVKRYRRWATVFFWIGSNAITAYLLAGMVRWHYAQDFLTKYLEPRIGGGAEVIAAAIVPVCVIGIVYVLYRKKLFLRL